MKTREELIILLQDIIEMTQTDVRLQYKSLYNPDAVIQDIYLKASEYAE